MKETTAPERPVTAFKLTRFKIAGVFVKSAPTVSVTINVVGCGAAQEIAA